MLVLAILLIAVMPLYRLNPEFSLWFALFEIAGYIFGAWIILSFLVFRVEITNKEIRHRNRLGKYRVYPYDSITRIKTTTRWARHYGKIYIITVYVDGEKAFAVNSAMHGYSDFAHCVQRDFRRITVDFGGRI